MIRLEGVTKSFGGRVVLRSLDLTVPTGTTTVLIGPSGCGKSTVLRLVTGLISATSGEIRIGGEPLVQSNVLALRRGMGYVIQSGGLFPHLSARANITLVAEYEGIDPTRIDGRLRELCALTKFPEDALLRYPAALSGGQRQRVALMRALMLDPDILLLDEPLGSLDPLIRNELQSDLRAIFDELRKTVLLVTHDMGEAAFFGGTIVLMNEGGVEQAGGFAELLDSPASAFVSGFINAQRGVLAPGREGGEG